MAEKWLADACVVVSDLLWKDRFQALARAIAKCADDGQVALTWPMTAVKMSALTVKNIFKDINRLTGPSAAFAKFAAQTCSISLSKQDIS